MNTSGSLLPIHVAPSWLVVNKPAGLATQAPSGIDSIEVQVKRYLAGLADSAVSASTRKTYLGVPHRLDRPASGIMVFARNKKAARMLAEQFRQRIVEKTYWVLVEGTVRPTAGTWSDWMRKLSDEARSELCDEYDSDARQAVLHYSTIGAIDPFTLLEIRLQTGRTHQIRLQCSARDLKIPGDALYGSIRPFGPQTDDSRQRGIALHARSLRFSDPETGKIVCFEAKLPEFWPDI